MFRDRSMPFLQEIDRSNEGSASPTRSGWQQKPYGVDGCPVIDLQAADEFRPACRSAESPWQVHFAIQNYPLLMTDRTYV